MRSLPSVLALEGQTFRELGNGEGRGQLMIQNINSLQKYEAVWVTGGFPGFLLIIVESSLWVGGHPVAQSWVLTAPVFQPAEI